MPQARLAFRAGATLALLATAGAGAAQSVNAKACLTPVESRAAITYLLPAVVDSTIQTCTPRLSERSYLRERGNFLVGKLSEGRDAAWPAAKTALLKLAGKSTGLLGKMSDDLLRPMLDATVATQVAPELKPEHCVDADRIAASLDPLPASNTAALLSDLLTIASRNGIGGKKIPICVVE